MSQPRLNQIISTAIFERAQLDLIDMRCHPVNVDMKDRDGSIFIMTYEWIAHMVDHSGQYHTLWAQQKKEGLLK